MGSRGWGGRVHTHHQVTLIGDPLAPEPPGPAAGSSYTPDLLLHS